MSRTLVTGGVRSGKSRYAEELLASEPAVTYIAAGYPADSSADPEWTARVAAHQLRRPPSWTTVETADVAAAIADNPGPVLVDCIGTWLTRLFDDVGWDVPRSVAQTVVLDAVAHLCAAVAEHPGPLVVVTNEVGWGLVSEHASGRLFADALGRVNQELGKAVDDVVLMVAGRPLRVPAS